MKFLHLTIISAIGCALSAQAADYTFVAPSNANWSLTSSWSVSGTTPATVPGAGDNIAGPALGSGGLGINGSRTVQNWTMETNQLWEIYGAATGTSTITVTGTFLQTTGTIRFRSNTGLTNLTALNINTLDLQGGVFQAGSGTTTVISAFTATNVKVGDGSLAFGTVNGGTATIHNLSLTGTGVVAIQPINSGYTSTLVVDVLTGTSGAIRTANSNTTVATGILAVGSGTFGGTISNANVTTSNATLALVKNGSDVLALTGSNSYTGGTTVNDGTLRLGNGGTTGQISGNVALNSTSSVLSFDRSNSYSFSGTISGSGQVEQIGSGTTTLSGNHTYTGTTSVSNGTLLLLAASNNIANSTVIDVGSSGTLDVSGVSSFTLASGQTLKGSGTIAGAFTVGNGATLAPGNSPGTLTFNDSLTLSAGSTSNFEINGLTTGLYDLIQGGADTQSVSFDGTLNLIFQEGFAANGTIKIFNFESYAGDFSTVNTSGLASGYSASFNASTGEITVVPEPGTCLLFGFGLSALLLRTRNCRKHD